MGSGTTSRIGRTLAQLIEFLTGANPLGNGTILWIGTGVIAERHHASRERNVVEITIGRIGVLVNPVKRLV